MSASTASRRKPSSLRPGPHPLPGFPNFDGDAEAPGEIAERLVYGWGVIGDLDMPACEDGATSRRATQQLLGHEDIGTTANIYVQPNEASLERKPSDVYGNGGADNDSARPG